jgi:hypothetical protein
MRLLALCVVCGLAGFGLARWHSVVPVNAVETPKPSATDTGESSTSANAGSMPVPSAPSTGSARKRLADAMQGDDTAVAAERLLAWIQGATIEDFRQLVAEGGKFPVPVFTGFNERFRSAYFDALAERWFTVDPNGALHAMQSVRDQLRKSDEKYSIRVWEADGLLKAAARVRPVEVLKDWPLEKESGGLNTVVQGGLESLAAQDPAAARKLLERIGNPESLKLAEEFIARGIARSDPVAAVAIGKRLKDPGVFSHALAAAERISPGAIRDVVSAIGEDLTSVWSFSELLLRHPDLGGALPNMAEPKREYGASDELQAEADRLSPEERQKILDHFDSLPASVRGPMGTAVTSAWARTEPDKAADWAMKHATPTDRSGPGNVAAEMVFLRWINNTPEAAVAWWRSLPPGPLRDAMGTNASTFLAEQGDLESALELFHPRSGTEDEQAAAHLTQILAERDPARAAESLLKVPDGILLKDASRKVIESWFPRDPDAVARWVESLPPGPRRDNATQAFIEQAAAESPTGAGEWVKTIADRRLRQDAAMQVYWRMQMENPAAAIEWIRGLDGVDPRWHARMLRIKP